MINLGIVGYGNLGKGVITSIRQNSDMNLVGVFSRRPKESLDVDKSISVYSMEEIKNFENKIDVMILCGGSATDLPKQTVELAKKFNVVDSFDTHAKIPEHFKAVNEALIEGNRVGVISVGWDPGLFSLNRLMANAILPKGETYTFWGKGVSQGHSDAIRRIEGVLDARQYTIPVDEALERVRAGENPDLSTREKHTRYCYVVAKEGYDKEEIREKIVTMPCYFDEYDTTVEFITMEELKANHSSLPHGGIVLRSGNTGSNNHVIEYSLKLDSNPEFTGSVLVAYARAVYKMYSENQIGCKTVFDIPPKYLINMEYNELIKTIL